MFPFPREYDRCLSIKNNHFANVRQISYPTQPIARGMLQSGGCSSDGCPAVMRIYWCLRDPVLGAGCSRGSRTGGSPLLGERPAGVWTWGCAAPARRAWDCIPERTAASSRGTASARSADVSCLFFYVVSPFCCQLRDRAAPEPPARSWGEWRSCPWAGGSIAAAFVIKMPTFFVLPLEVGNAEPPQACGEQHRPHLSWLQAPCSSPRLVTESS